MRKSKYKASTVVPLALTAYLAFMAYYGRHMYIRGEYLYYFGTIAVTLAIIVILHFSLKKKEKLRQEREDRTNYDTYHHDDNDSNKNEDDGK